MGRVQDPLDAGVSKFLSDFKIDKEELTDISSKQKLFRCLHEKNYLKARKYCLKKIGYHKKVSLNQSINKVSQTWCDGLMM